jgi:hypothetical protein
MNPYAVQSTPRRVLERLLGAPRLAELVKRLDPKLLHQLVRQCGLEECGEILALATTEQLTRIFDDDLWASSRPGIEEELDAERFGLWLEVLAEPGPDLAAHKLAGLEFDFVTAAVSRLALVFDQELAIVRNAAGELGSEYEGFDDAMVDAMLASAVSHELGGYTIVARRGEGWDALVSVLASLDHNHHDFFGRLMQRCVRLSTEYIVDNGGLYDVLSSDQQVLADAAGSREDRQETEGYVPPSQATAFLRIARGPRDIAEPAMDPVTAAYFRELAARSAARPKMPPPAPASAEADDLEREIRELLTSGDDTPAARRPQPLLLRSGGDERLSHVRRHLFRLHEEDAGAYSKCTEELAYLANVLLSGCSFQSRRFRSVEAADAALAVCNLGLERGADGLSLVRCFQDGWRVLYEEVSLFTARGLAAALSTVSCRDPVIERLSRETARQLLRRADEGEPWRARDEIEAVAMLDLPSWAVLQDLLDECPVVPRDLDGSASRLRIAREFDFISEARQIAWVRDFVGRLPESLRD